MGEMEKNLTSIATIHRLRKTLPLNTHIQEITCPSKLFSTL